MEDKEIIRGIGDVTMEVQGLSEVMGQIKNVLESSFEKIVEKKNYDDGIGELIKNSISEAIGKISSIKIDMAPVSRIAIEISKHNQNVINAIASMQNNGGDYSELFSMIVKMIQSNQEFIKAAMNQKAYLDKMDELIQAAGRRPSYVFEHELLPNGNITRTKAEPIFKS